MLYLQKVKAEEEDVLHNIMQFYIYEFSKYIPDIRLEQDGVYKPFILEKYWDSDNFHAYFIKVDNELIGFGLVESATVSKPNSIEEFFIMAKHSGNGYGKKIAKELFEMFPGDWKITQIESNRPAYAFWHGLIKEITKENFTNRFEDGQYIQEFNTDKIT
ncbi:GNAT family N-acetyltransferase [Aquisalibacillus elongatus]|uniref:Putative acetyltransferase n=1 Tax=Aquisalibacillus elongatus TaxID=485577 RepID=A0A3N5BDD4_9BACI|nr:GNAT family N-acetyltransferase [Aquisalibacillus elongatus]RPF55483.1 putative acetyltransferase [Aquisalibacillus elongatus]